MAASLAAFEAAEEEGEAAVAPLQEAEEAPVPVAEETSEAPGGPAATELQAAPAATEPQAAPAVPIAAEDNYEEDGFEEAAPSALFPPSAAPFVVASQAQKKASIPLPVSLQQSMPIRNYLDSTIVPVLRSGLRELVSI